MIVMARFLRIAAFHLEGACVTTVTTSFTTSFFSAAIYTVLLQQSVHVAQQCSNLYQNLRTG